MRSTTKVTIKLKSYHRREGKSGLQRLPEKLALASLDLHQKVPDGSEWAV
jgi:hypothetical protein